MWGTSKAHYASNSRASGSNGYDLNFLLMGGTVGLGASKRTGRSILESGNYVMQWYSHENPDSPGE